MNRHLYIAGYKRSPNREFIINKRIKSKSFDQFIVLAKGLYRSGYTEFYGHKDIVDFALKYVFVGKDQVVQVSVSIFLIPKSCESFSDVSFLITKP